MFDATSFIGTVENLIIKNNTTTSSYSLITGLKEKIRKTFKGCSGLSENLPVPNTMYPAVFVELNTKGEHFADIGTSARRRMEVHFSIIGVTNYGAGTTLEPAQARENANHEAMILCNNLESLIRNFPKLSSPSYVSQCNIESTEYANNDSTYNCLAKINCMAECWST